jgi:hypothetical protein
MEKKVFAERLQAAMRHLIELCRPEVDGVLPDKTQFRVLLNRSFDGHADPSKHRLYPEDDSPERQQALRACSQEQVVDELWRDGRIPEWIDARVVGETGEATCIELTCCGRFTADETRLYHRQRGYPPFALKGPDALNSQVEYLTLAELAQLPRIAHQVQELTLVGPDFDDAVFTQLPDMPRLQRLNLRTTQVSAGALVALRTHVSMDWMCVDAHPEQDYELHDLPPMPALGHLQVSDLRTSVVLSDDLWRKVPKLRGLLLASTQDLTLDLSCLVAAAPALSSLELRAGGTLRVTGQLERKMFSLRLQGRELALACSLPAATLGVVLRGHALLAAPRLAAVQDSVWLHLECAPPGTVEHVLEGVQQLRSLHLQGTPMNEHAVAALVQRWRPQDIDVTDTGLEDAALHRLATLFKA